ncbi:hypothetical protein Patl1_29773 [Pistacia atlantica]|uniref:Uncharacterized protein n=1 Tax=Pistacia atlantica TaxID=434234 RepID=A0ACC1ACM7_9ROSI|nr:hypothetical protein Patl1_29773 [Pistacia atlantica]
MPTTTGTGTSTTGILHRLASDDQDVKLKALRELKNQIIGNRTKKLSFLKLGAVPAVAAIPSRRPAVLGSFACGFDAGVQAVLEAGAFPNLSRLLSNLDDKVVGAGARSLKMIYQSKFAPNIITHSCKTSLEQKILFDAGVLKKLTSLLKGSLSQRDASLESLATIFKNNPEVVLKFVGPDSGRALGSIIELVKDRFIRTRLLASSCLIVIRNTSPCYLQDVGIKAKLINTLLELLDDPGQIGEEASFAFSSLITQKEDMQKLAFELNAIDKLYNHLQRVHYILDGLKEYCWHWLTCAQSWNVAGLDFCRCRYGVARMCQVLNLVIDALAHESADVRTAACICLRSVSRSIKNLSAGYFMNETVVIPLVQLLNDPSTSVQLDYVSQILLLLLVLLATLVVDLTTRRSTFIRCGGVKQLVQLSKSMDATIRLNALWALRNLMFLAENKCKEGVFSELTAPLLASLICDPESFVQEQALALVCNLIDGCIDSVEYMFAEDGVIFDAVGRQLQSASKAEIGIQGMYVLSNVATGKEFHKEAVINQLLPHADNGTQSCAFIRSVKLRDAGIVSQMKEMVNDPCLDVKLRVRTALKQFTTVEDGSI